MAETFTDGEVRSSIRSKINAMTSEVNSTRRSWHSQYVGSRCTYLGDEWDLTTGGNPKLTPGSAGAAWVKQTRPDGIVWKTGNILTRVEAHIAVIGYVVPLVLRTGGTTTIDPNSAGGPANWALDYPGTLIFNPNAGPYYPVGQLVFHTGRLYTMVKAYTTPPTQGTDEHWRDVFADASVGNESTSGTEQGGTGTSNGSSDGTATTWPYVRVDASTYNDSPVGSSGQRWEKTTAIPGYNGAGAARTIGAAASIAEGAYMNLSGFGADNTADRKVWMRVLGASAGSQVAGASQGTGTTGTITTTVTSWQWIVMPQVHKRYDASYRIFGISDNVAVDSIIITASANPQTPVGKDGFKVA